MKLRCAAAQMVSSDNVDENLSDAADLIAQAASAGARLVVLPENFAFMGRGDTERLAHAEPDAPEPEAAHPMQYFLHRQARQHGLWLIGGTIALKSPGSHKAYSAMLVFGPDGARIARYDKIYLFDVDVPGNKGHYRESESTLAGNTSVAAETDFGGLGLAICYDLRFPELFRELAGDDLSIIALGAAFTAVTGQAHWEPLLRARAIENLTAVVAAAQGGAHTAGRETYGHSMIIDAWGKILAQRAAGPGVIVADIDLAQQAAMRERFPVLKHRR